VLVRLRQEVQEVPRGLMRMPPFSPCGMFRQEVAACPVGEDDRTR
jgi:hypothetical protein